MDKAAASGHTAHAEPNYMSIFYALFVLTVAEVGVVFLPLPKIVVAASLVAMALTKAVLVAAYFMHLRFEKRTLAIIAGTPLVLCVFLALMLMPDAR